MMRQRPSSWNGSIGTDLSDREGEMSDTKKISTAFEPVFADSGPNDKHEAIVVFALPVETARPRGRLRTLQERLRAVQELASTQRPAQEQALEDYQEEGGKTLPSNQGL